MSTSASLRSVLAVLVLATLFIASSGCDTYRDDLVVVGNDVIVQTYAFDGGDLEVSSDGTISTFHREVPELDGDIVNDGAVLLYAGGEILFGSDGAGTWTALPVTVGVDEDGDEFIDYTITFSFSYDIEDLYVDLIGSSPLDFGELPTTDLRLVMIPGNLFVGNAMAGVDHSDYEAVERAYGLSESVSE